VNCYEIHGGNLGKEKKSSNPKGNIWREKGGKRGSFETQKRGEGTIF